MQLTTGADQATAAIDESFNPEFIPSPDRIPRIEVYEKEWAQQSLGNVRLAPGRQRLVLHAPQIPGGQVAELKNLTLVKVAQSSL